MTDVLNTLNNIKCFLINSFDTSGIEINEPFLAHFNQSNWLNQVWTSDAYRKAQLNIIQTDSIYMMHCCIFPHIHNSGPIFGFDLFAGSKKITGCFHDFSPTIDITHPLLDWFEDQTKNLNWSKVRSLPNWAITLFNKNIIAVSNVQDTWELNQIEQLVKSTTVHYLNNIGKTNHLTVDTTDAQNFYCYQQKLNPHNAPVLISLGLNKEQAEKYINVCLFPEI